MFLNFTFERAELRVWYKCLNREQTPYYLNIELISENQRSIQFKDSAKVTCQITDHNNRPTQYNWVVFDITNLMLNLQTINQNHLKNTLKFSIKTSSHLIHITKQIFNSKYAPSHLPLLAFYDSHVVKQVEPRDVSMRYIPSAAYSNQVSTQFEDGSFTNRRDVRQAGSSSCSRISKSVSCIILLINLKNRLTAKITLNSYSIVSSDTKTKNIYSFKIYLRFMPHFSRRLLIPDTKGFFNDFQLNIFRFAIFQLIFPYRENLVANLIVMISLYRLTVVSI